MSRDDIIFRPRLERRPMGAATRTRARQERTVDRQGRRGGVIRRLAALRGAKYLRRAQVARTRAGMRAVARGGTGGFVKGLTGRGVALGIGAVSLGAMALAAVAALRVISGRSFENMGAQVNKVLLGDLDEKARAKMSVRDKFRSDPMLARFIGVHGMTDEIRSVGADLAKIRERTLRGEALIMEDPNFQVNSTLDILILRAREQAQQMWERIGGPEMIRTLQVAIGVATAIRTITTRTPAGILIKIAIKALKY